MNSFRTRSTLSAIRQLARRNHTTGVLGTAHWWMLGTGAPLAACAPGDDPESADDLVPNANTSVIDKTPTIANPLQDTTVAGNDTTIDLNGVFDNGDGGRVALALTASLGTVGLDRMLTLSDSVFAEGTHTITVTATDADGDTAEATVELVSDKTPTIANVLADLSINSNSGTIIDLAGVFDNGSGNLTYVASAGAVGISNNKFTLDGSDLADGLNTLTITATDADSTNPDSVTSTFVLTTDKTPTIAAALPDAILASNTTVIDLNGVFAGGSGDLTLGDSLGIVGSDGMFTLSDIESISNTHTITFTATDADGDTVKETVEIVSDKTLIVANTLQDATVAGNDTIIDLNGVFESGGGNITLEASLGTLILGKMLTLSDSVFTEGTHTITITASDGGSDTVKEKVVLVSDKTPTIDTDLSGQYGYQNFFSMDPIFSRIFAGGSGNLTFTASHGTTIGTDDKLTLGDYAATEGTYTITVTATDEDGDTVEKTHRIVTNYVPTIANALADASFKGNGGTTIDLTEMFTGGTGKLTLTASAGMVGGNNILTLAGSDLVHGVNILTVTATDADGDAIENVVRVKSDKFPSIANALDDATVAGNDAIIDLNGVFESVYGDHTLAASLGSIGPDNTLTISDAKFTEGTHMITITATDADGDEKEEVFALISDKTPTIAAALPDTILKSNTTVIDLNGVFGGGSSALAVTSSLGNIGSDGMLTLSDAVFTENTQTITFTATDTDGDAVEETVVVVSDQTLIIATPLQDATVVGNDTTIDLSEVFESSVGSLSLDPSLGAVVMDTILTISDAVFTEGTHTITITATDGNNDTLEETFVLVSDKTPTVANTLADVSINSNSGTIIDLAAVFNNGSGMRTLTASAGMVGGDNTLTLVGSDLAHGVNTLTVTATDADGDATTEVFQISTTKTLDIKEDAVTTVYGAFQHSTQTFDVEELFITNTTSITFATSTLPSGITLSGSTLSFANTDLSEGAHAIIITATDGGDELIFALTYALDTIKDQSEDKSNTTYTGTTLADAITDNAFAGTYIDSVYLRGGDGDDIISSNKLGPDDLFLIYDGTVKDITLDGGDGHDIISSNTSNISGDIYSIAFDGGAGNDTISSNTLTANPSFIFSPIIGDYNGIWKITFDGGDGHDTISGNTLTTNSSIFSITVDGGAGNDTISSNTLTAGDEIRSITFDGGAGNDTISDNHFDTGTSTFYDVSSVTLMGGAGDDVFRDNTASQANGELASLTIDGGDGEDKVVFRSIGLEYAGISDWTDGVTTITLSGDGAAVTLIDVETIAFADGTNFTAADAWVIGYGGFSFDLANAFAGSVTAYSTKSGTISSNTLTLADSELAHGANTIVITATTGNNTETIVTITVNAVKNLEIIGAKQHDQQIFDLGDIFAETNTTTYNALALPNGVTLSNGNLTFNNAVLSIGEQPVTVTATDGSDAHTLTLNYALGAIKDQSGDGSYSSYTGTNLADAITGNTFAADQNYSLTNVRLDGGAGNDTISNNTLMSGNGVNDYISNVTFDGGTGNDTISNNSLMSGTGVNDYISKVTFDGGAGNDTISNNSLTTENAVFSVTFDGGAGNDTISDNHLESTGTYSYNNARSITLMGGTGDDVFRNNSARQANGKLARMTIDGGDGEDTVVFRSVASDYDGLSQWINLSDGEVTTIILSGDGATVRLLDVETISFADGASYNAADAWVEGNEETLYDLTKAFPDGTFTAYSAGSGSISGTTLTLSGSELAHGANTILVTATANDSFGTETTETITVNAVKTLKINGRKQHDQQTFDLGDVFVETTTTTYNALNLPSGVTLADGTLTFNNTLSLGNHPITITATDGNDALTLTLNYALEAIKDQTGDGSYSSYTGTTLADAISGNAFVETNDTIVDVYLYGGDGNDTISSNTLTARDAVRDITFDGGAGDDVFRDNIASQANGESASLTIDGGDGEDTVVFRSVASEYAGLSQWIDGVTTITLSGDGAAVTLFDVETLSFADGVSYNAADAWVVGNEETLYDLTNKFSNAEVTFTAYSSNSGTITGKTLTLAGTEFSHGVNTILVTATANDSFGTETTKTITVNAAKTLKINGAKQHDQQTFDLGDVFAETTTYKALNLPSGVILADGTLTFNNTLSVGNHLITIAATDSSEALTFTLTYGLEAIMDQSGVSNTTYTGTTLADAITGNAFVETNGSLTNIDLDGGAGNDTISNNSLSAYLDISQTVFYVGNRDLSQIKFDGGDGDDTISNNSFTASNLYSITFAGGDGDDTISKNTITATDSIYSITFDGGDGDDTISDNHLGSTGQFYFDEIDKVTLEGGAGNDVFRNNTAIQSNSRLAELTIDGGADPDGNDSDKVYFALESSMFTITGSYSFRITVTDNEMRTKGGGDTVDSYAKYILTDIEELFFAGELYEF